MTVCVQYSKPSSGQNEGEVYGLDVAVNNFLSAWFRFGTADKFISLPVDVPSYEHFEQLAAAQGLDPAKRCIGLDPRTPKQNLESISTIFRPDPLIGGLLWRRRQLQGPGYAACGLVHTMSGERIAQAVSELCIAPAETGDTLICPSPAVRDAVRSLWEINTEYLNHHFKGSYLCPIDTPVIPLGIDTEKFARLAAAEKRAAQRQALGASDDEIVILFLGRLSFATKAHPLALWQAAEQAAQATGRKLRVVMLGYFKPKDMESHFRNLAADIAKHSRIEFIANNDPRFPDGLWAGADIFVSLADNIQESFGLTPIEAMAAGLPAVVSDWNGYRGGVRDGIDGFLIPTLAPPPDTGMAIAEQYYNEQNYGVALVGASQSTFVDTARCAEAFAALAGDAAKRRQMGESGRARAQDVFDWRHIIKAYEELWREIAQKRRAAPRRAPVPPGWAAMHPAFPNPWRMFAGFPGGFLSPATRLRIALPREAVEALMRHDMNYFEPGLLMPRELLLNFIDVLRGAGTVSAGDILAGFEAAEQPRVWRCIGWMLKLGIAVRG
ncbi:MAG: glycosyltransferase family 4 protein [Bdellovibrionales bacterium]